MKRKQINIKIGVLFLMSLFFLTVKVEAQVNTDVTKSDSASYYFDQWSQNLHTTANSWISKKTVSKKNWDALQGGSYNTELPKELGMIFTSRSASILEFYKSNNTEAQKAAAVYYYYKKEIEKILVEKHLPPSLSALTFALTAMNIKARSFTGAAGFWQLNYSNGRRHNLTIENYVDERLDVQKSTVAVAENLKVLHSIYKDWKLVVAAYVCGPTNVNKAIRRNGNDIDYYTIQSSLPWFGRDAVDAFAASIVYLKVGNVAQQIDFKLNVDTVEVSRRVHFQQIKAVLRLDIDEIRFLNPVYKQDVVPAINKIYHIYLPAGNLVAYNTLEDSIHAHNDSVLFNNSNTKIIPNIIAKPPTPQQTSIPPAKEEESANNEIAVYYTIKNGDNLGMISAWFDVTIQQVKAWNKIQNTERIQAGTKLKIYVPYGKADYYRHIDKLSLSQKQKLKGPSANAVASTPKSKTETKPTPVGKDFIYHTVKAGESPFNIATKYPGVTADDILRWNDISDPRKIQVGQKLKIRRNP